MKGLLLALVATVAGLLMVGGGIYGIVAEDDGDDDSPATTTVPFIPSVPDTATTPGAPDPCLQARARDLRLGLLDNLDLQPVGKETGSAEVRATCAGTTVTLSIRLEGLRRLKEPSQSYFVWLFESRRRAKQIGSMIGSQGTAFGTATIQPGIDTSGFEEIVITRVPFGTGEKRPRQIVFRGGL